MAADPRAEYASRLESRRAVVSEMTAREEKYSTARLLVFIAGVILAWVIVGPKSVTPWAIFVPILGFGALVIVHGQAAQARRNAERACAFYENGLARLDDTWAGKGEMGLRYLDTHHPYAQDLDLFGKGSVFELMCTARTRSGEKILADWLCGPADPAEIRGRHAAVDELRPRLDLREDLAILGENIRATADPEALAAWSVAPARPASMALQWATTILGTGTAVTIAGWLILGWPPMVMIGFLACGMILTLSSRARVKIIIEDVERRGRDIALIGEVLERLERERFTSPRLSTLSGSFATDGLPPSRQIARLRRLIDLLDSRRNELFAAVAFLMLWGPRLAFAIEGWRAECGPAVPRWLAAMGELEALGGLAGYAWEHPSDPWPEILEGAPGFEAESLGHPLIPDARVVRNDLRLGTEPQVHIISGSNMSGKSTFLRTVGVNAVLAQAGAPVRAKRLRLTPLAVGASISRQDSLLEGTSRFYAEIQRIRQLVDLAQGPRPLLFLVDEVLHGTNSHDRLIGGEAVVRGFLKRGGIGLVTTHDLSLAKVADALTPKVTNVHFEDQLENGRMVFDYRLRPGVVQKSNALELMRSLGLDV